MDQLDEGVMGENMGPDGNERLDQLSVVNRIQFRGLGRPVQCPEVLLGFPFGDQLGAMTWCIVKLTSPQLLCEWWEKCTVVGSLSTERCRCLQFGLMGCKARKKPLMTNGKRRKRILWARQCASWSGVCGRRS